HAAGRLQLQLLAEGLRARRRAAAAARAVIRLRERGTRPSPHLASLERAPGEAPYTRSKSPDPAATRPSASASERAQEPERAREPEPARHRAVRRVAFVPRLDLPSPSPR